MEILHHVREFNTDTQMSWPLSACTCTWCSDGEAHLPFSPSASAVVLHCNLYAEDVHALEHVPNLKQLHRKNLFTEANKHSGADEVQCKCCCTKVDYMYNEHRQETSIHYIACMYARTINLRYFDNNAHAYGFTLCGFLDTSYTGT